MEKKKYYTEFYKHSITSDRTGSKDNQDELYKTKAILNSTKTKLHQYYERAKSDKRFSKQWNDIISTMDIYKHLRKMLTNKFTAQVITNASLKYYELVSRMNLIPRRDTVAFLNAEFPGGSLSAVNHYMHTFREGYKFDWVASSIVSNTEDNTALEDMYGFYEKNPDKWLMHEGNNGDMMSIENVLDAEKQIREKFPDGITFYSHDAGIDVTASNESYNEQETLNAKLHFGCALAGLFTLAIGGNIVMKQYSFFEPLTWNLILLYADLFKEFYIAKPLTSRPFNSEIYLVGIGFRGMGDDLRQTFIEKMTHFDMKPLLDIPPPDEIVSASKIFINQSEFIMESIRYFNQYRKNPRKLDKKIKPLREKLWKKWLDEVGMKAMNPRDFILSNLSTKD